MSQNDLIRLVEQYHNHRNSYRNATDYNEQNCRDEFISPLLECFGWDVHNKKGTAPQYREVVVEKFSTRHEKPDYTLTLNGVSKFHVETKKPAIDITTDKASAYQARSYGWNANHKITVLTNFEYLSIYDTTNKPLDGDSASASLYRQYRYTDYVDKYSEISALISRDAVYSGKYDKFVSETFPQENRFSTEIDEVFLAQVNGWRLQIGNDLLRKDNRYADEELLNDVVQEFINQILFLRICEDRNLPLYRSLLDAAKSKDELRKSLTSVLKEADKRYNSGLFARKNCIFNLENNTIENIILSLYYPQVPYMFDVIEPGILGKIYEHFLTQHLVVENGEVRLAVKKEYKYRSVVSTPTEIVKYMVRNTLTKACSSKSPDEVMHLKIADIACGSGIFLSEALQFLFDYCVEWYETNNPSHLLEIDGGRKKLPLKDKKELLQNCIFGVDIDIHAVEVCRFSLLLKLIEDETEASVLECTPILPNLEGNIQNGNALLTRQDLNDETLSWEQLRNIRPFSFDEIYGGILYDVIIGNPPYVKTEDIHTLETDTEFRAYKKKYRSAYKQFDKYYLFVERALSLLKDDGLLCYIIPNKFFKIDSGRHLRELIAPKITEMVDFGDLQLFPDKTIYSSIVTMINGTSHRFRYSRVNSLAEVLINANTAHIDIPNTDLGDEPWRLSTDIEFMKMVSDMEQYSVKLIDIVNIFNGIQTSAERPPIYWFSDDEITETREDEYVIQKFGKTYHIEKAITRPYFKPTKSEEKGFTTYGILKTNKRIIFPYDSDGHLIPVKEMSQHFKGAYEYLEDCYPYLVPRTLNCGNGRDIPNANSENWYQYGRTQSLTVFTNTSKLIVRVLSKQPMYAYDDRDMLIASGGTAGYVAITEKGNSKYDLFYIQAWLNHPYTEKLLRTMGSDFENGFTARGTFLLKKLPFVNLDFRNDNQLRVYNQVVSASRQIHELNRHMLQNHDKATVEAIEREKAFLEQQIESCITNVYELKFGD